MNGIAITMVDFDTGQMRDVIPHTWENIHTSSLHENYVFYNSSYSGIDNIYAIDLSTRQRYQVTSRKFGSFNPDISPDGTKLVFQDYTVKGYDVAEMLLEPSAWKPIEEIEDRNIRYYEPLIAQEQGRSILDEDMVPDVLYEVKNYNVFTNLVKFHTWSVLPTVPSGSMGIISNNELNTMSLGTGFDYNANEKVMGGWLNLSYAGFFPILDAGVSYGGRASSHDNGEEEKWTSWNELSARFGMRVPLVLSRGIYYSSLELGISAAYRDISDKIHVERFEDGNGVLMPLTYTLRYNRVRDASVRDFLPRWAQTARFSYSHTPGKRDYNGSIVFGDARLFFPGLFKHHSLKLGGAYERQEPDNYRFESRLLFPRGYSYRYHRELYKASVDYAFPLLYPDLDLGPLLYLKRIKGKFFYDHGVGRDGGNHIVYNSVGTEVSAEFNLFLLPISLDLGVRYSYRFKDNEHRVESIFLGATL